MTNETLREVWPWHLRSKIGKLTEKRGLKFCKLTFLWSNNQITYKFS